MFEEEETCCAGLAGICLGWGAPASPGAHFEETGEGCSAHRHLGLLFLAGLVVFLHVCLQHWMQISSQGAALRVCGCWLGFIPMQNEFIGMY